MKKSPAPSSYTPLLAAAAALALCLAACQNANHLAASGPSQLARPAAAHERPAPPSFSTEYSVSALYDQYQWQWRSFSAWLSSGMMQPHRTVFPR